MANRSGIHIKKSNKGKFTASAKRAGMGVQEYARHVLANKGNYDATTVRRANFARSAKKWHHADGGLLYNPFNFGGYIPLDGVVQLPPQYDGESDIPVVESQQTVVPVSGGRYLLNNLRSNLQAMPTRGELMDRISENIYPRSQRPIRVKNKKAEEVPQLTLPLNIGGNIVYGVGPMPSWYDYGQQVESRNPHDKGGSLNVNKRLKNGVNKIGKQDKNDVVVQRPIADDGTLITAPSPLLPYAPSDSLPLPVQMPTYPGAVNIYDPGFIYGGNPVGNINQNDTTQIFYPRAGLLSCGGRLRADGGDLGRSNGAYWPSGLTYVDAGGTHEQNPNEGVQMGEDNQGTPNLVEQGEVIYNDYVFSNRLTPNKSFFENGKKGKNDLAGLVGLLPKKYKRNTYAKIAEDMGKEIRGRENDPISKRGLERNMSNLEALQETQRAMNGRKGTQQLQTPGYDMAQQPVQQYGMDQYGMQQEIQPMQETGIGTSMEQQPMIGALGGRLHGRKFDGEENTNEPNYALRVAQSMRKNYPLSVDDSYVPENDYMYNYINQDYLDQPENGRPIVDMFHLGFRPRYGLQWSPVNVPPVYIYQGGNGSAGSNGSAGGNGGSGSYQASSANNSEVPVTARANANDNGNGNPADTNNPAATEDGNGQSNPVQVIPQYSSQPEKGNIPEYDTRLRYAPVAGSLLSALGTVLQPLDLQEANDLFRMAGNVRTPSVRARMLNNYVKPRLMDRNYALNPVLANAGATRRMINGTNGGNRMAGLVAAGYNAQNAVGNTLAQVNDYNNKLLLNAAQFNRATDQYNSQQALSADTANAGYMMNAQQLRNNLLTAALGERGRQKDARGEAISSALSQAFNNLGAIGTQNFNANQANLNPLNRGYYNKNQGGIAYDPYVSSLYGLQPSLAAPQKTSPAEGQKGTLPNGQEIVFKNGKWKFESACGGRLMTKKRKRR